MATWSQTVINQLARLDVCILLPALAVPYVRENSFAVVRARGEDIRLFGMDIDRPHPLLVPVDGISHGVSVGQIESANTTVVRRN